jgi:ferredoxin
LSIFASADIFQKLREDNMVARINEDTCTACGACIQVCPVEAIKLDFGSVKVDPNQCTGCGTCVEECPVEAVSLVD